MHTAKRSQGGEAGPAKPGWHEVDKMDRPLGIRVPDPVRAIFQVWAQPCDPAPILPRGGDPRALVEAYLLLSAGPVAAPVERRLLARVYVNAALNRDFGMWSELRQEAAAIVRWLAPLIADDPALRACIAHEWQAGPGTS